MRAPDLYLTEAGLGESTNLYKVGERHIPGSAEILGRGNGLLVVEVIGSVWCVKRSHVLKGKAPKTVEVPPVNACSEICSSRCIH